MYLRLVNILHLNEEKKELIWTTIRDVRKKFLLREEQFYSLFSYSRYCQDESILLHNSETLQNIHKVEKKLGFNLTYDIFDDVTDKTLRAAAEMFTYLTHCPPKIIDFYKELFQKSTLKDIIDVF